jgi:hypothetical protein
MNDHQVENCKVKTLVTDIVDTGSKNLIWRASARDTLSGDPEKNTKAPDKGVQKMFAHLPPLPRGSQDGRFAEDYSGLLHYEHHGLSPPYWYSFPSPARYVKAVDPSHLLLD